MGTFRIALPKGRLLAPSIEMLQRAGLDTPTSAELNSRRLVFRRGSIEWILVKDCDVPVYVDHGGAEAGIAGLDQILERDCVAHQPVELPFGHCQLRVIGRRGAPGITSAWSVATKYPRISQRFLESRRLCVEIVPLGGSVELAAVLGLTSHVIDLVETGETVRAHDLELLETVAEISARLIVCREAFGTNRTRASELITRVGEVGEEMSRC